MKRFNYISLISLLTVILLSFACNSGSDNSKKLNPTAIEMMADVFEGDYSSTQVKSKMDAVMKAYNVEITEKNYEKCGSSLVSLRKAVNGVTEMDIIKSMLELDTGKGGISFPDQAALSAALLEEK